MAPARKLGYAWHLRMRMAEHDMFATTDLVPLLAERDVVLSAAQVYRLVTQTPERLSLRTLMALCDILQCSPNDLVEPVTVARRSRATGTNGAPVHSAEITSATRDRTPRRAGIRPDR